MAEEEIDPVKVANGGAIIGGQFGRIASIKGYVNLHENDPIRHYSDEHPYSAFPKEWPPPVEVTEKELPAVVRERCEVSGRAGVGLCGIFLEIRRAWASIDNSLFIWSFEQGFRDAKCLEYTTGREQDICAVGFANPTPRVFDDAIKYLLVLATRTELILVGVCSRTTNEQSSYAEISLLPLSDYTVPLDGVAITCITCTNRGRILLAGCDGHIYELLYTKTQSFWSKRRCYKVCLTSSRWLETIFGVVDPIVEMFFCKDWNSVLFVRTKAMKLEVYLLDHKGGGLEKRTQDITFTSRHQISESSLSNQASIVSIVHISIPDSESHNLVAVLSDGSFRLWSIRDSSLGLMLLRPSKRIIVNSPEGRMFVVSTMGMTELIFNRPVDILTRLLESSDDLSTPALEQFFNRFGTVETAGMCLMLAAKITDNNELVHNIVADKATQIFENPRFVGVARLERHGDGQDVEAFSGAYEGLCRCVARLLVPLWDYSSLHCTKCYASPCHCWKSEIVPRESVEAMEVLENRLRSLERFLRSCKIKRKGLYARLPHLGSPGLRVGRWDMSGYFLGRYSRFFKDFPESHGTRQSHDTRQLPDSADDIADLEVRATECLRHLMLKSSEALFFIRFLLKPHAFLLLQSFDDSLIKDLLKTHFQSLLCNGQNLTARLISALLENYRGTEMDIMGELSKGCPSYFKDYMYQSGLEYLKKAASYVKDKEYLARRAFNFFKQASLGADLHEICKQFEFLRFYEAVVNLPLQKAQVLDPDGGTIDEQREQCYEVICGALRNLNEKGLQGDFGVLDPFSRKKYISQILRHAVGSTDKIFREYLYRTMIDMSLESELLEHAGPDLELFLKDKTVSEPENEISVTPSSTKAKYLYLLARYYVIERQPLLAASVFLRLAEKRSIGQDVSSLDDRYECLCDAALKAKNEIRDANMKCAPKGVIDDVDVLHVLEQKLAVARFQIKLRKELESIASASADLASSSSSSVTEKVKQLSSELKTITQLYNDYAVPFQLWEACLEMLYFADHVDDNVIREIWTKLINQSLSRGGLTEACSVLKRVSRLYAGDVAVLPQLDTLCLHLERAAVERCTHLEIESISDDEIPETLLSFFKGAIEPVLNTYTQLLSRDDLGSAELKLRFLCSVLFLLKKWSMPIVPQRFIDQLISANRYAMEVQSLQLPESRTDKIKSIYDGFLELKAYLVF